MLNPDNLDWQKNDGLLPAIVQDADSGQVLMLGYMNRDALARTLAAAALPSTHAANSGCGPKAKAPATISTSKASAPTATATLCSFSPLLLVQPATPAHKAASTNSTAQPNPTGYFSPASNNSSPHANTPTPKAPIPPASTPQAANASAQKVGEEGVETALAAATGDKEETINEAADLTYHLTVLLQHADLSWADVIGKLKERHG